MDLLQGFQISKAVLPNLHQLEIASSVTCVGPQFVVGFDHRFGEQIECPLIRFGIVQHGSVISPIIRNNMVQSFCFKSYSSLDSLSIRRITSLGQQRQTLMFPLALLRATRLQTTSSEFWPGLIGLMAVVHSESWTAAPAISMQRAPSRVPSLFKRQRSALQKLRALCGVVSDFGRQEWARQRVERSGFRCGAGTPSVRLISSRMLSRPWWRW